MPFLHVKAPDGKEWSVPLTSDSLAIGKRDTNDLVLEGRLISREHCVITHKGGGSYLLRDLGSRNGTYVGDYRISSPVLLRAGMEVKVGEFVIVFSADGAEAAPAVQQARPAVQPAPAPAQATPVELKRKIHSQLLEKLDLKHEDFSQQTDEQIRGKATAAIKQIIRDLGPEIPSLLDRDALVKEIADEAVGLGPIEDMLADPEIDEIMVNGWDRVYVERHGRIEKTDCRFTDDQQVVNIIRRIISPIGRRIDESSPMVDARLPDGSRVNAIISPLSLTGPSLTIRKFAAEPFTVEDLVTFGTMNRQIADYLELCVRHRRNILISGGTGSGKTTLLNVVCCAVPDTERIVTIEDAAELKLPQEHVVSLEAKPPNIEGGGAIPIRKLVINSLRMRPDRIIIGECRGGEALDMLQAMNTGHDGSLTTIHANSARDSLRRLETMVLMAGLELPSRAIREQVASAIQVIVHTARLTDGSRKVMNICEIAGMEKDTITLQDLYVFRQRGFDEKGGVKGYFTALGSVPAFVHELRDRGIEVDMGLFQPAEQE